MTVAQDFSPGTALWVDEPSAGGTTESLLHRTNSIASKAGFDTLSADSGIRVCRGLCRTGRKKLERASPG
jgi:hypothetical protein